MNKSYTPKPSNNSIDTTKQNQNQRLQDPTLATNSKKENISNLEAQDAKKISMDIGPTCFLLNTNLLDMLIKTNIPNPFNPKTVDLSLSFSKPYESEVNKCLQNFTELNNYLTKQSKNDDKTTMLFRYNPSYSEDDPTIYNNFINDVKNLNNSLSNLYNSTLGINKKNQTHL